MFVQESNILEGDKSLQKNTPCLSRIRFCSGKLHNHSRLHWTPKTPSQESIARKWTNELNNYQLKQSKSVKALFGAIPLTGFVFQIWRSKNHVHRSYKFSLPRNRESVITRSWKALTK